jgi:site-specific DNA-methyltransferase (adenine-specific)
MLKCEMPVKIIDQKAEDLTDEDIRELRIADNKTNESPWDFEMLTDDLDGLDFEGFDFDFDLPEEEEPVVITEDDYDKPLPDEPKSKLGDIYQLGQHRLMCGDSTDPAVIERLMDGGKADMVFTDPPYNIASESKNFAATGKTTKKTYKTLAESEWDKNFNIKPALENISAFSKKDSVAYICTSHFLIQTVWDWAKQFYDFNNYIVWCKPNPTPSLSKRHWTFATELIVYATRGKHTCNFPKRQNFLSFYGYEEEAVSQIEFCPEMNYWILNKETHSTGHPTQKPIKLCAKPISFSSKKDDIVLDLFGGSGSTLIACEQLGRKCYMAELDPRYVDAIIDRWQTFTGEKAVLISE